MALIAFDGAQAAQPHTQFDAGGDNSADTVLATTVSPAAVAADFALVGYGSPPRLVATAFNYYVSPTGSDTASGSLATPFKTLARAVAVVTSKAAAIKTAETKQSITVWVAPGTYSGGFKTTAGGDVAPSGRIYYVSTTKWGAKIAPPATGGLQSAWDNRGHYVSIVGFEVDGSKLGAGPAWTYGIYSGGSYTRLEGNKVHHVANTIACNNSGGAALGIDSYYKGVKGEVIGNLVHDIGPAGCTFVQGIYISTSAVVTNNVLYRAGYAAIHLWHDANDVVITNNTVSWSRFGILIGGGDFYWRTGGADNIRVHSNIVFDNAYGIAEMGVTGCNNVYSHNLVSKNMRNWSLKTCVTHTSTVTSDPLLVGYSRNVVTPDFHLTSSSPAIGRATATLAYPVDFEGRPRNASTGYDIGAFQH